ncbi:DUF4124 domain-containing protein [Paracidovorax valerianellae]|uniref:DUF4124 domain-containing protein n=1 Tax=Paracidovorax valerianellae TaxID=187868 RepID=A0A1G7F274_9BURK|nr:DUF4124 domain-containing protein [Paracidovorax valerianellae]MDA8445166.1 DUF4124 domain-containing protein [Paracidovorax valerianellae]SDE70063.1 protein of unknown function [Paracidovorax valerianellae]
MLKKNFRAAAALAIVAWAFSGAASAQTVYKWVDAQGRTQYGQQPPDLSTAEQPQLHNTVPFNSGGGGSSGSAPRKLPRDVQEQVNGLAKGLTQTQPGTVQLDCGKAVTNARDGLDTMLETGEKNTRDGYMSREQYDSTASKIRSTRSNITMGDCQSATGVKRDFYQCISNGRNHVMGCAQSHRF